MKRFTETGIWDKLWFRKLTPRLKSLWKYLCDRCDPAGVLDADWEAMQFYVGEPCSEADLQHFHGNAVMRQGRIFLPQFIEFQYGRLSEECRPHDKVFEALRRHGLKQGEFKLSDSPKPQPPPPAPSNGRFTPPTPEECAAYAGEISLPQEERMKFLDFYASKGWKVGKAPMKDWKAAMRNWKRNAVGSPVQDNLPNHLKTDDEMLREALR